MDLDDATAVGSPVPDTSSSATGSPTSPAIAYQFSYRFSYWPF